MNESNKLDGSIPDTNHSFQIDLVGAVTKKRYLGDFECKIPTTKDQCKIDRHVAALNGEYAPFLSPGVLKIHRMIGYLKYTLTDFPKFWKEADLGYDLRDSNVIEAVYDEVLDFEEKWMKKIWGDDDGEAKASETEG